MKIYKLPLILFLCCFTLLFNAQSKSKPKTKNKPYPETFSISKIDFDKLLNESNNTTLKFPSNIYIDKSTVQMNTKNGDMHFVKLKLNYFPKSYLLIQENGTYSTIIFIMSDDKSVFYKGKLDKELISLKKCSEDDIVSE